MGSIAMTQLENGITTTVSLPLTMVDFKSVFSSLHGKGACIEGETKDGGAVRVTFSDAEQREISKQFNASLARAGQIAGATKNFAAAVPPAQEGAA